MITAIAMASIASFAIAFSMLGVAQAAAGAVTTARESMTLLSDSAMDDQIRERAVRRASGRLFLMASSVAVRGTLAVAIAVLPVLAAERAGIVAVDDVFALLSRWDVVIGASALLLLGHVIWRRKRTRWSSR